LISASLISAYSTHANETPAKEWDFADLKLGHETRSRWIVAITSVGLNAVLVAVPRMIESLKQKIERDLEYDSRLQPGFRRWWTFRDIRRRCQNSSVSRPGAAPR
jgi:hypothetical protein